MIFAVIPAAGHSTRMGQAKLALPLAGRTVIEHVVAALLRGGCDHVLAVIGPHVAKLAGLAESAGAHSFVLEKPTPDMRSTVEQGLDWLESRFHPRPDDGWLLAPGDHPTLKPEVVGQLLAEFQARPGSIVVPTYAGRRGHPTLIAWRHVAGIRTHAVSEGLNSYLRKQSHDTIELSVTEKDVLCDLDTPADYERLRASFEA